MEKLKTKLLKPWFAYTFAACSAVLLYAVLWHLPSVAHAIRSAMNFLSPVIIGAVTAYLFNPVSCFFERKMLKKMKSESGRHTLGVIITIICVVLVLVLLLVALIPSLVKSVSKLVTNWDSYIEKLDNLFFRIEALAHRIGINISISNISSLVEGSLDKLVDFVKNNTNTVLKTAGSIGSDVTNIALGLVFGFCFLAAKKAILDFILKIRYAFVDKEKAEQNDEIWKSCHNVFLKYFGCTLLDALIVGIAVLIFMLILRLPYAPLIAVIVAITNIIPTVGPIIGGALGAFFLILDRPVSALWFILLICAVQAFDAFLIKPKLFKGMLGIPGVWTLVLIILGSKIAGMLGIILAIPFAAIVVILYDKIIVPKLERRTEKINMQNDLPAEAVDNGDADS